MIGKFLHYTTDAGLRAIFNIGDDLQYDVTDWRQSGASFTATAIDTWDGHKMVMSGSLRIKDGAGTLRIGTITYDVTGWRAAGDGLVVFEAVDGEWLAINEALGGKVGA